MDAGTRLELAYQGNEPCVLPLYEPAILNCLLCLYFQSLATKPHIINSLMSFGMRFLLSTADAGGSLTVKIHVFDPIFLI